jgi:hypothetical protein
MPIAGQIWRLLQAKSTRNNVLGLIAEVEAARTAHIA